MAEARNRLVNFCALFSFLTGFLRLGKTPLVRSYFSPIIASTLVRNSIEAMKQDGVEEVCFNEAFYASDEFHPDFNCRLSLKLNSTISPLYRSTNLWDSFARNAFIAFISMGRMPFVLFWSSLQMMKAALHRHLR